jgi:glycine/D-amino acid oxidase-like deaminating enzyme
MDDFLIIGGGIAGTSAAARLAAHGRVTLLEAEPALGYHASGRSAALFEATYGKPSTVALNRASYAYHADGGFLSPRGLMMVGGPEEEDAFLHDLAVMEMERVTVAEARRIFPILNPDTVAFAATHAEAWDIDTDRLIQHFAKAARANGQVVTSAPVTAIRRTAAGWAVTAAGSDYEARILVNAAGAWADRIAAMAGIPPLGLTPLRRSMARIPAPGGRDVSAWPMIFGAGETWYAKPDAGKLIVSPAEEDPQEPHDAWADDMVLAEGLARYEARVTEPVTRVETSWAGLRTFSPDRCLVLGPDPLDRGFVWCAGQGGYGFQTSPAASALLAARVTGTTPDLPQEIVAALAPDRFRQAGARR